MDMCVDASQAVQAAAGSPVIREVGDRYMFVVAYDHICDIAASGDQEGYLSFYFGRYGRYPAQGFAGNDFMGRNPPLVKVLECFQLAGLQADCLAEYLFYISLPSVSSVRFLYDGRLSRRWRYLFFFKLKWVPWRYLSVRRSKAGGMHLANIHNLKSVKDLNCPAARLMGTVHLFFSSLLISLEKKGVPQMPGVHVFIKKPKRDLLIPHSPWEYCGK
jgi:hypothetical protein